MRIRVLLFAAYREAAGWSQREIELEEGATAADLWSRIRGELEGTGTGNPLCALDERHVPLESGLREGATVAFFPPVSGGSGEERSWRGVSLVQEAPLDPAELEAIVRSDDCGALCSFLGIVRDHHEGRSVEAVSYEAYPEMAGRELGRLCREAEERWAGVRAVAVHRTGRLEVGEASVAIFTAAPHRAEAFAACRFLIEAIKESVPIWKKDHFLDGSDRWRDPFLTL